MSQAQTIDQTRLELGNMFAGHSHMDLHHALGSASSLEMDLTSAGNLGKIPAYITVVRSNTVLSHASAAEVVHPQSPIPVEPPQSSTVQKKGTMSERSATPTGSTKDAKPRSLLGRLAGRLRSPSSPPPPPRTAPTEPVPKKVRRLSADAPRQTAFGAKYREEVNRQEADTRLVWGTLDTSGSVIRPDWNRSAILQRQSPPISPEEKFRSFKFGRSRPVSSLPFEKVAMQDSRVVVAQFSPQPSSIPPSPRIGTQNLAARSPPPSPAPSCPLPPLPVEHEKPVPLSVQIGDRGFKSSQPMSPEEKFRSFKFGGGGPITPVASPVRGVSVYGTAQLPPERQGSPLPLSISPSPKSPKAQLAPLILSPAPPPARIMPFPSLYKDNGIPQFAAPPSPLRNSFAINVPANTPLPSLTVTPSYRASPPGTPGSLVSFFSARSGPETLTISGVRPMAIGEGQVKTRDWSSPESPNYQSSFELSAENGSGFSNSLTLLELSDTGSVGSASSVSVDQFPPPRTPLGEKGLVNNKGTAFSIAQSPSHAEMGLLTSEPAQMESVEKELRQPKSKSRLSFFGGKKAKTLEVASSPTTKRASFFSRRYSAIPTKPKGQFDASHLPPSPTTAVFPPLTANGSTVFSQSKHDVSGRPNVRQAVAPTMHTLGSIRRGVEGIEDAESRRLTEIAFLS